MKGLILRYIQMPKKDTVRGIHAPRENVEKGVLLAA
jgi:hypothetical protein